jgi:hypothetical protein
VISVIIFAVFFVISEDELLGSVKLKTFMTRLCEPKEN